MELFASSREIGIDAGHRVTNHHSKCRNIHGHRYRVVAEIVGGLAAAGAQEGMTGGIDFAFLKEEMMQEIDVPCDHGLMLWVDDPILLRLLDKPAEMIKAGHDYDPVLELEAIKDDVQDVGYAPRSGLSWAGKLYIMDSVPTAENLARHWFQRLAPRVLARSHNLARLSMITVWETPNCKAVYSPELVG